MVFEINMNQVPGEDYDADYWPQLRGALDTVLLKEPGSYQPISYEQMYSAVYKCVCKQYSDKLYSDLLDHVSNIVRVWVSRLSNSLGGQSSEADTQFVIDFEKVIARYLQGLSSIVPIFTYLNRFYVEGKLHSDLRLELQKLFIREVPHILITKLVAVLVEAQNHPFRFSPATVQSVVQNLYHLNPEFSTLSPELFSRHLVGIQAPMTEDDLEAQRAADRALQEHLRMSGFNQSVQGKKRLNPDFEEQVNQ